jgi:predicted  nucleic acid-binding Zn-ribbon protein
MAVHLEGGDPQAPILPEGTEIPAESSFLVGFTKAFQSSIGQLEGVLTSVGEAAEQLSTSLDGMEEGALSGLLTEATGLASDSRKFLVSTESAMTDLKQTVQTALEAYTEVAKDIEWVADDVGKTAETAKELIEDVQTKLAPVDLAKAQADLETALSEFARLTENLNATLSRVDGAAESVTHDIDNMEYALRETLNSATEALNAISTTVAEIQENPSSIIRGRGKPKESLPKESQ